MLTLLKKLLSKFGVDGAIGFTLLSRIISASGGLITLVFIASFLTTEEQGYYYTFGSIVAIQIFFELGLNGIITQYVAHEVAHLKWGSNFKLEGNNQNLSRLSSLLHFCIKTFGAIAVILFLILSISGYVFFTKFHHGSELISWELPWLLVSISTTLLFLINPLIAFIEGLGKVKDVAKLRFFQQLFNVSTVSLTLIFGGKLWALGVGSFLSFIILAVGVFFTQKKRILLNIYHAIGENKIHYWNEIFPYQWKIAVSWISGYFIFQLFNPVLFATEGPKVAGQMGMTLAVLNGISALSMSWITTKIPKMASLIAVQNYSVLDGLFNRTIRQLTIVNVFMLLIFNLGVWVLHINKFGIAERFLPLFSLLLLSFVTLANQFVFSWATYLRCHKKEPYLINSITLGFLSSISTLFIGKYYGLLGIVISYSIISIPIGMTWGFLIYKNKKSQWHTH